MEKHAKKAKITVSGLKLCPNFVCSLNTHANISGLHSIHAFYRFLVCYIVKLSANNFQFGLEETNPTIES